MLAHKNSPAEVLASRPTHNQNDDAEGSIMEDVPDLFPPTADYQPGRQSEDLPQDPATPSTPAVDYMAKMMESQMDAWSSLRSAGFVSSDYWLPEEVEQEEEEDRHRRLDYGDFRQSVDLHIEPRKPFKHDGPSTSFARAVPHRISTNTQVSPTLFSTIPPSPSEESFKETRSISVTSSRPDTGMTNRTSDSFMTCEESNASPKEFEFYSPMSSPLRESFVIETKDPSRSARHSLSPTFETFSAHQLHERHEQPPVHSSTPSKLHSRSTTLETAAEYQDDDDDGFPDHGAITPQARSLYPGLSRTSSCQADRNLATEGEVAPEFDLASIPIEAAPQVVDNHESSAHNAEPAPQTETFPATSTLSHQPQAEYASARYSEDTRSEFSFYQDDGVSSISDGPLSIADDYSVSELSHDSRSARFSSKTDGSDVDTIRGEEFELQSADDEHRMSIESSQASVISAADLSFRPWSIPEIKPTIRQSSIVGRFNGPQERGLSFDSVAPPPIAFQRDQRAAAPKPKFSLLKRAARTRHATNALPDSRLAELELLTHSMPYEKARKGETPFTNSQVASVYPQKKPWAVTSGNPKKAKKVPIGLSLIQEHEIALAAGTFAGGFSTSSPLRETYIPEEQRLPSSSHGINVRTSINISRMPALPEE